MPAPLQAVHLGTLPAAIGTALIAEGLFANGALSWKVSSPFDFRLVGIQLCLAAVFWYFAARSVEFGRSRWKKVMWSYIGARLLTIPASLLVGDGGWMIAVWLFILAWIAIAASVALHGMRRLVLRRRSATALS